MNNQVFHLKQTSTGLLASIVAPVIAGLMLTASFFACAENAPVVTADNYVRAETDFQMQGYLASMDIFGKFVHSAKPYDVNNQTTVRGNRDTLYSFAIFDLSSPLTVTLPDPGARYQSLMILNQDHSISTVYGPKKLVLTKEGVGTRYVFLVIRTFMDPNVASDVKDAQRLQQEIQLSQADRGSFEVPAWDKKQVEDMRSTINVVSATVPDSSKMFGNKDDLDPVYWLLGAAMGWVGAECPPRRRCMATFIPRKTMEKLPIRSPLVMYR